MWTAFLSVVYQLFFIPVVKNCRVLLLCKKLEEIDGETVLVDIIVDILKKSYHLIGVPFTIIWNSASN